MKCFGAPAGYQGGLKASRQNNLLNVLPICFLVMSHPTVSILFCSCFLLCNGVIWVHLQDILWEVKASGQNGLQVSPVLTVIMANVIIIFFVLPNM